MQKVNEITRDGFYVCDHVEGKLPSNWTRDLVGDGYYRAQYQKGSYDPKTGEWTGGTWVEVGGVTQEQIDAMQEASRAAAIAEQGTLLLHASNVINTLVDEQDFEGVDRTEDIKTWRLYRVSLKNVDVNQWPIIWPEAPSLTKE